MAETASPDLEGPTWAQCTCPRCEARREQESPEPGCPCKECQPGPGLNFESIRWNRVKNRQARLRALLQKDELTRREQDELDMLLHLYTLEH